MDAMLYPCYCPILGMGENPSLSGEDFSMPVRAKADYHRLKSMVLAN